MRVRAASVDRGTWHIMSGLPYPIRLAGFGLRRPKYANPGRSLAGTVEAVGAGRDRLRAGRRGVRDVHQHLRRVRCGATRQARPPKPANLSFDQAAAVPISGGTALQAVRDHGRVQAGDEGADHRRVRRRGQLRGADREGVRRRGHRRVQHGQGRHGPRPRRRRRHRLHAVRTSPTAVPATTSSSTSAATPGCPGSGARSPRGDGWSSSAARPTDGCSAAPAARSGPSCCPRSSARSWAPSSASENAADLDALRDLVEAGELAPAIDRTYPLAEAAAAIRHLLDGQARGKLVISVSSRSTPSPDPGSTP